MTLTLVYEEDPPNGDKHYASVPVSTKYEARDVLNDARQCFEEYLPENLDAYKLELKHEIGEGRWATIHPRVFTDLVEKDQAGEFKLNLRQIRRATRVALITRNPLYSLAVGSNGGSSTQHTRGAADPPPYATVIPPGSKSTGHVPEIQVVNTPTLPIFISHHEAHCDRCNQMISGVRYKCTSCDDFDYCGVCIGFAPLEHGHRFDAIINARTKVYRQIDAWRATGQAPPEVSNAGKLEHQATCDLCEKAPIRGTRFKCADCPDWDTCEECLDRASRAHPEHTFIRVADQNVLMRVGAWPS
ncbi:hypothetical protein CTheo_177 [Ceratobasidium theobromae]|uniref:ZZ-type domain-containing protein n=1 Tax=Ceratobasidium theobromae TaxID=1582974 RepID=A0A5N5QXS4_9AGAM|nr:hypothetical protein CTheo_177 [Ceratobasidium theobromae]